MISSLKTIDGTKGMDPSIRNVASEWNATGRQPKRLKSRRAGYFTATWMTSMRSISIFDTNKASGRWVVELASETRYEAFLRRTRKRQCLITGALVVQAF